MVLVDLNRDISAFPAGNVESIGTKERPGEPNERILHTKTRIERGKCDCEIRPHTLMKMDANVKFDHCESEIRPFRNQEIR
jgi:hypothetical protein